MQKNGFTLIEMMIVIVILAVLAAIAVPSYNNYIKKAKINAAQSALSTLSLAAENYYQRNLSYNPNKLTNNSDITAVAAFSTWSAPSDDFSYSYQGVADGTSYSVTATGVSATVVGCTLSLTNTGIKTINGCGVVTSW